MMEIDAKLIDTNFPIRLGDKPSYRQYQRETTADAADILFVQNKKFVGINAPVGSGKSAINVTLEKIAGMGSVYLTPLTILQDQIVNEEWPGMAPVKGRSNYYCAVFGESNTRYTCDYEGTVNTCNSHDGNYHPSPKDIDTIAAHIDSINSKFQPNLVRMKTSFSSSGEFKSFLQIVQKKFDQAFESAAGLGAVNIKRRSALESLCCSMGPSECPVKSSRLRAQFCDIAVMNPDIFFHLCRTPESGFNDVPMMVFDECQQIENVIGRLFRIRIPTDTLTQLLGIDFSSMMDSESDADIFSAFNAISVSKLGPFAAVGKVLSRIESLLRVKNISSLQKVNPENDTVRSFKNDVFNFMIYEYPESYNTSYPMTELLDDIFSGNEVDYSVYGNCKDFVESVRQYFYGKCNELECSTKFTGFKYIIESLEGALDKNSIKEDFENAYNPDDSISVMYYNILIDMCDKLYRMMESIESMNKLKEESKGTSVYIVAKQSDKKVNACSDMQSLLGHFDKRKLYSFEKFIDIIPVDTGKIMNYFFYSHAEKVVLSSGTWVAPQKLFDTYGLPADCDLINVPSTFPKENRPIFVIQNNDVTDFSEKEGRDYIYKTESGANKFLSELSYIIGVLRNFIQTKHGEKANIVVHCHTFDIARKVASHMQGVDDKVLVHIPMNSDPVKNIYTGRVTDPIRKNQLIDYLSRRPNEGITLVSPSMSEGVDFKYDLARGQIILKRPTPSIGDPYIKIKMNGNSFVNVKPDRTYFNSIVLTTLVQQYGRIMRAKDDYGYTVIIDQSIAKMLKPILQPLNKFNREMMNIEYFLEGIQYKLDSNGFPEFLWF